MEIRISDADVEQMKEEAIRRATSEILATAKNKTNINAIIESSKARLTNGLQKQIANDILASIDLDEIIAGAVSLANTMGQQKIQEAFKGQLMVSINFK